LPIDARFRPRLARLVAMNTGLAVGTAPTPGFIAWRAYAASHPDLAVGSLIKRGTPHLTDAEVAAYDAPFPDVRYKAGVRAFPQLVMTDPSMPGVTESRAALKFWSEEWSGQAFMAIGAADPVLGVEVMRKLHAVIRNCSEPLLIAEGGHFLQEWGADIAAKALDYFAA
jgi:pimeloyl-ACP methyl ester carboxylesterase